MNKDLIKREDAIKALYKYSFVSKDVIEKEINAIPSADRPQGEWLIEKTCYDNYNYRCSYCDWYETHAYPDVEPYNFCPNCGSKMRGEHDD